MNVSIFECSKCGTQTSKWQGRCLECGAWGSLEAGRLSKEKASSSGLDQESIPAKTVSLDAVQRLEHQRISTKIKEFDRVLGGGIVPGSLVLIGGDPGIGKSTLVLQAASQLSGVVLYVSGEESPEQLKLRADRLKVPTRNLQVAVQDDVEAIVALIKKIQPRLVIVDSIQTMFSSEVASEAGSVNQIKVACLRFLEVAKKESVPIWLIGHVTKDGSLGGPKTLEHYVDTVIYFEGDEHRGFRLLRTTKNRFGSTSEVGMFEMCETGLKEVDNPSAYFSKEFRTPREGSVFTMMMEGKRPVMIEIQALVNRTSFGYPQRRSSGFDRNRLELLLAVLEKRGGVSFGSYDVHVNVVGGLSIQEPAADLAVAFALVSARGNATWDRPTIVFGELGLTGEIRPVHFTKERLEEARNLGITQVVVPEGSKLSKIADIKIQSVSSLKSAILLLKLSIPLKAV